MGNRKLKVIPTCLSLMVTYVSAVMILGEVAETYDYGISTSVGMTANTIIIGPLLERLIVPWIYSLKLVSVYEVSGSLGFF